MVSSVLVVHGLRTDSRETTINHSLAFARYLYGQSVTYVNGMGFIDGGLRGQRFDVVVVTYELLAMRTSPLWYRLVDRIAPLMANADFRVAMPQDDYTGCALLDDFFTENRVDLVLTPVIRGVDQLYPKARAKGAAFREALTGYWEPSREIRMEPHRVAWEERTIDLGQRVRGLSGSFGDLGRLKASYVLDLAQEFERRGLRVDVSTREEDALLGDAWWSFLGRTRFTTGTRGGASLTDPMGTGSYVSARWHPPQRTRGSAPRSLNSSPLVSRGDFTAPSPRIFEAAAMETCQIMPPDDYVDGMLPWVHYVPVEPGNSLPDDVLDFLVDPHQGNEMAARASTHLLDGDKFTYESFVRDFAKWTMGTQELSGEVGIVDRDHRALVGRKPWPNMSSRRRTALDFVFTNGGSRRGFGRAQDGAWDAALRTGDLDASFLHLPWCSAETLLY